MPETPARPDSLPDTAATPADPEDGLGGRPPEDAEPDTQQDAVPDTLAAGDTGWSAVAAPGHPDGEVDTRA